MKISYNWLKEYVDFNLGPEQLSELLTDCGLEVEGLEKFQSVKGGLEGIVIGEVLTAEKHPNADKLTKTTVDVGREEPLHIVCGAPNVAAGQKVPVATVGTTLYSGDDSFQIKKSRIRGELSEGMICAEDELGLGTSHEGIMVLGDDAAIGTPGAEYFGISEDWVYEIGLTPNRSDAASHIGVARDIATTLNHKENTRKYRLKLPYPDSFHIDNEDLDIDVILEDAEACPRYTGISISDIEVKESPEWMKNYLNAIGAKPINNIVDITNFVLFETGQPLHAFDAATIPDNKVIVKKLPQDTPFITLDEEERKLSANDLMICNTEGGMCIGGVFGGIKSGVTETTKSIFLESAYFDPSSIRKSSKYHGLQTDASFRFERGTDPNFPLYALKRAALLIKELAGGKISSQIKDNYPKAIEPWDVSISYAHVDRLIGKHIPADVIKRILQDLEITIKSETAEGLELAIPTFKVDVTREADVIEEILRVYGFNEVEITDKLNSSIGITPDPNPEYIHEMTADYLSGNGFAEIMNNSLTNSKYNELTENFKSENNVKMLNALSMDLDVMRQTLVFGALETVVHNQNRQNPDLKLFEFGRVYHFQKEEQAEDSLEQYSEYKHLSVILSGFKTQESWKAERVKSDFYDLKGVIHALLTRLGVPLNHIASSETNSSIFDYGMNYTFNEKTIVEFGQVSKQLAKAFDIKQEVYYAEFHWDYLFSLLHKNKIQYTELPKFPEVRRDLALLVNMSVKFEDIEKIAYKTERNLLKSVNLFDIYVGDTIESGKKSYAVSFILQNPHQTLTDKVVDKAMKKILFALEQNIGAQIR